MRKTARLDQILITLGYATQEQITRALARQRSHGGRLGTNLVQSGFITADQLLAALAEQFQLPSTVLAEKDVPVDLLGRMPQEVVLEHLILPLAWNSHSKVLTLAVANPEVDDALQRVKEAFGARATRLQLASDVRILEIGKRLLRPSDRGEEDGAGVELPELFELEETLGLGAVAVDLDGAAARPILMVSSSAPMKNFLTPVLQREGIALTVAGTDEEVREALENGAFEGILLAQGMVEAYGEWVRKGKVPEPEVEVVVFPSVSGALLENPLPYEATVRSLRSAVQALADHRCAILGGSPPYGLIATDLEALAHRLGARRIVVDGLNLAAHLLLPRRGGLSGDPVGSSEPFSAFASSLELATRIRFPWRVDTVLDACHALFSGREADGKKGKWSKEVRQAAQMLALVWYRHNHVELPRGTAAEAMVSLRAGLRDKAGRLAPLEMVETYLRIIGDRGGVLADGTDRQVLLVGGDRISRALGPGLRRVGCQVVVTGELADAQTMAERRAPGAIVIDHEQFQKEVDHFSRVAKLDAAALLFVLTDTTDPSLVLNLLDIGVDDVFGPPHDFEVMAARINRAIVSRARQRPTGQEKAGQFSATFEVFSFLDLIQTLGQGFKSVRIDLNRDDKERAVLFMRKGQVVHASCGRLSGPEAVYRVIAWEDQGEFTVNLETQFPDANVQGANESLLMEGCRLLDESRR